MAFRLLATADPAHLATWPSATAAATAKPARIAVLDSSHNPPTVAHYTLLKHALEASPESYDAVLILLATRNADKGHLSDSAIDHRAAMMHSVARSLNSSLPVAVATTEHALFLDKARAVREHAPGASLAWIVGTDTLHRIFHPKYYSPNVPLVEHLAPLFDASSLVVAARPDLPPLVGVDAGAVAEAERRGWVRPLVVPEAEAKEKVDGVSSSAVREQVKKGDWDAVRRLVLPEVCEAVFAQLVRERGLESEFRIDSAGTAGYHIGSTPDERSVETCVANGVPVKHVARQVQKRDFDEFDYILCMDRSNLKDLQRIAPRGSKAVVKMFGEYDPQGETIILDPYYGGMDGFERNFQQAKRCSAAFLAELGF
ncbi:Low molecular weight phosphotyrosine protein phosphatase [Blastocladiella emersonii ATCC 22665]|nr:Low molecular weight phosphotyrosine protein phosphatase [Blastocladiella emersonii ATCC 22665]